MLIKRSDKRGQIESSLAKVAIAVIFVIVIALGIYYVANKGKDVATTIPEGVSLRAIGCKKYTQQDYQEYTKLSYCNDFRISSGVEGLGYINCPKIAETYPNDAGYQPGDIACDGAEKNFCKLTSLNEGKNFKSDKVIVNGKKCSEWMICTDYTKDNCATDSRCKLNNDGTKCETKTASVEQPTSGGANSGVPSCLGKAYIDCVSPCIWDTSSDSNGVCVSS